MTDTLTLWQFVRGDMPTPQFEQYAYSQAWLEEYLGYNLYLDLISLDFNNPDQVYIMQNTIKEFLLEKEPLKCECIALSDIEAIDMGSDHDHKVFKSLDNVKAYGKPLWWLDCYQCRVCKQYWMVANEQIDYDTDILKRIDNVTAYGIIHDNIWPNDFKVYSQLYDSRHDRKYYKSEEFLTTAVRRFLRSVPNIKIKEIATI